MATAAPFTWSTGTTALTDGSGNWNATGGTNWFNGTTYGAWGNLNVDTATFGVSNGAAGTITVGGVTANGITFNSAGSGNYTLSSGTITMAGTTPTITVNATGTTTLTSVLAGSAGFTKSGAGTLLLGTGNTYTGTTTISQGAVRVTGITNTLGNGSTGAVNLNGGTLIGAWTAATTSSWAITVGASGGTFLGSGSNGQLNLATNSLYGSGVLTLRSENGFNRFFTCSPGTRRPAGSARVVRESPRGREPAASSNSRHLSFSIVWRTLSRRRGSTGIATTGCLRRITSSGGPSQRSRSGTSASNARP